MNKKHYVHLPIKNAYNVRDLGGYPCANGGITRWNTLLRADDLSKLTKMDIDFLKDYGVSTDIDLRSREECTAQPDALEKAEGVNYLHLPLMTNVITDTDHPSYKDKNFLSGMYIQLVDNAKSQLKQVFKAIIEAPGAVVFHCSAGKDRTGVVAMLLLGAAGVDHCDIISNYETTYTYIRQNPDFKKNIKPENHDLLRSHHEYIENVLNYINSSYGGVPQFLISIGLTEDDLNCLKEKITME